MANYERKEVLRCLIAKVSVNLTSEIASGTIYWLSGRETSYRFYRRRGRYRLIEELYALKLSAREIVERLDQGKTSTGQKWKVDIPNS